MVADGMFTELNLMLSQMDIAGETYTVTVYNADMMRLCHDKAVRRHWADGMLLAESDPSTHTFMALAPGFTIQVNT